MALSLLQALQDMDDVISGGLSSAQESSPFQVTSALALQTTILRYFDV